MTDPAMILHGTPLSGHAHRVELLLLMLGLPYRFLDAPASVRRTAAFRALNPLEQIPVLQDGDLTLADSNAILVYLAKRYDAGGRWLPEDAVTAAQVQRWLSIAAGEVRYGPATARMALQWGMAGDPVRAAAIAERLLVFMDEHLQARRFLAADHPTIADLACYSYVAHAPEGAIPLDPYPAVRAWIGRVEALPHFKPMPRSPLPSVAPAA
jgi:glutathione S-transferase